MHLINKEILPIAIFSWGTFIGNPLAAMTLNPSEVISEMLSDQSKVVGKVSTPAPTNTSKAEDHKKWPMFNPNSLKNSYDLWLNAEVLFWKSNMGSLDYATTSKSTGSIDDGHVKPPDFNWDWGFRLGLGYKLPHDKWDIFVNYTYVEGKAQGHAHDSDDIVFAIWATNLGRVAGPFFAKSARARWHMNLNMGDIELGRTCFASQWLTLRPFIGVRGLVIDQDYSVEYKGGTVAVFDEDKIHMDTDFWGVGIRMGVNSLWGLGKGLSIYGNGSASLLSGNFKVYENERLKKENLRLMNIKRDVDNIVVAADLALGLQWDYMFSKNRYHFALKLGWECDMFFNQNQLFHFLSSSPGAIQFQNDDLSFQGVTLGFRFDL
jgi:hypothetical protein